MASLQCYLLGPPRIEQEGISLDLSRRKALALFAYLTIERQVYRRDTLATLLWPDYSQGDARRDLGRMLSVLRKTLGNEWLLADRQTVGVALQADLWVDVRQFQERLDEIRKQNHAAELTNAQRLSRLNEAVALYQGDFMAGFTLPDSPEFDDWQSLHTQLLRKQLSDALEQLSYLYAAQGQHQAAIEQAQHWLTLDPLHEAAHRQLMQLYAWSDQHAASLRQYHQCVQTLKDELGVPPSAETTALYEQVRSGDVSRGVEVLRQAQDQQESLAVNASLLQPASSSTLWHNLPPQPTPFVGRTDVLAEISQRLNDPACRLLTLVGPGGIGKTRLAIQTGLNMLEAPGEVPFEDGIFFVALAPVSAADFLVSTIADALGFAFYGEGDPQTQLLDYLREKRMLLILDNFEHLLSPDQADAGPDLVSQIALTPPALKLLVTSRERLNVQAEWLYAVSGMHYPEAESVEEDDLAGYSAVWLFGQRAQQVQPSFSLTAERDEVIHICQLVEGMPLGIELAASWLSSFTCQQISQEIRRSLDFLSTRLRDLPARHRSMRAVFESAWQLLSEEGQAVLSKVSVFRGGFDREAAEAVMGATLPVLTTLVEKSVLIIDGAGRYQIHELLRQFAAAKLETDKPVQTATQDRHRDYYLAFLQRREERLHSKEQPVVLAEIQAEIENVCAAWSWAVADEQVEALARTLTTLHDYYQIRSHHRAGQEAYEQVLAVLPTEPDALIQGLQGKLLARLGTFIGEQGAIEQAQAHLQAGLDIARRWGDRLEIAFCLYHLSTIARLWHNYEAAQQFAQESLTLSRESGDQVGVAKTLLRLGFIIEDQTRYADARAYYQESLTVSRALGHPNQLARALNFLGRVNVIEGNYAASAPYLQESLALCREIGDQQGASNSLYGLGLLLVGEARWAEAKQHFEESLAIRHQIGARGAMTTVHCALGKVCLEMADYETAQAHGLATLQLVETTGVLYMQSMALSLLGDVAAGRGNFSLARGDLRQALMLASEHQLSMPVLEALTCWGHLLLKEGTFLKGTTPLQDEDASQNTAAIVRDFIAHERYTLAVECLTLVTHHPAGWQVVKDRAARLLAALEAELSPVEMAAAQARGQARDMETTVAEVLAALAEDEGNGESP